MTEKYIDQEGKIVLIITTLVHRKVTPKTKISIEDESCKLQLHRSDYEIKVNKYLFIGIYPPN